MPAEWDPQQYRRFAAERAQPFHDLIALVEPGRMRRAVDLGCGPGEMTALAADQLGIEEMLGIDNSPAMLAATPQWATDRLRFAEGDISVWTSAADHDLVLAAASLQWIPDHRGVLRRWTAALAPGGQLAVQVPANALMPSHVVATELANSAEYRAAFGDAGPPSDPVADNVLRPEEYAQTLYDLGYSRQHVRLQVYPHVLPTTRHIVEWVRGTTLTRFARRLPDDVFQRFLGDYERRLVEVLGGHEPQFFPFRRILMWGRLA